MDLSLHLTVVMAPPAAEDLWLRKPTRKLTYHQPLKTNASDQWQGKPALPRVATGHSARVRGGAVMHLSPGEVTCIRSLSPAMVISISR